MTSTSSSDDFQEQFMQEVINPALDKMRSVAARAKQEQLIFEATKKKLEERYYQRIENEIRELACHSSEWAANRPISALREIKAQALAYLCILRKFHSDVADHYINSEDALVQKASLPFACDEGVLTLLMRELDDIALP